MNSAARQQQPAAFATADDCHDDNDAQTTSQSQDGLLSIRDLHLAYGGVPVLNGINLDVKRGHAVSIIGPSGSGKSSIPRFINRLVTPQRGAIRVDGIEVREQQSDAQRIALRKRAGYRLRAPR